jgi:hypothetical protein
MIRFGNLRTVGFPINSTTPEARHYLGFRGFGKTQSEIEDFILHL